jgi:hypothetical protein
MIAGARFPVVLATALLLGPARGLAESIAFAGAEIGQAPKGFEPALTGKGSPGRWEVVANATADGGKALAQVSTDPTVYRFPLLIHLQTVPADLEATIRNTSFQSLIVVASVSIVAVSPLIVWTRAIIIIVTIAIVAARA